MWSFSFWWKLCIFLILSIFQFQCLCWFLVYFFPSSWVEIELGLCFSKLVKEFALYLNIAVLEVIWLIYMPKWGFYFFLFGEIVTSICLFVLVIRQLYQEKFFVRKLSCNVILRVKVDFKSLWAPNFQTCSVSNACRWDGVLQLLKEERRGFLMKRDGGCWRS